MSIKAPSGYSLTRDFFGTVTAQGPLVLVTLSLPWDVLTDLVVAPDPDHKSDFNRPLTVPHARRFGQYLDLTPDAFTPPISLFTDPDVVHIESLGFPTLDEHGLKLVKLKRNADVFILDGQHRIYGVMKLSEEHRAQLRKLRDLRAKAESHQADHAVIANFDAEIRNVQEKQDQLTRSQVSTQILLTSRGALAKRIFADVADNAKGISQSQRADFSDRSVFNRVARHMTLSTLDGHVDRINDRLSSKNSNWLSLKDVVNVAQVMQMELGQRWTTKKEQQLKDKQDVIEAMTRAFFEGLFEHFEELQQLKAGLIVGYDLRARGKNLSLLGSTTMIRTLAAAYGRLRRGGGDKGIDRGRKPLSHADIFEAWSSVLPPMIAGHEADESGNPEKARPLVDQTWLDSGAFKYPYVAPMARMGDLKRLANLIVSITTAGTDD